MMRSRVKILATEIDPVTMAEAIATLERFIDERRPTLVFTVNVDGCMKVLRDRALRAMFRAADLVLVDGTPMMWAARFLSVKLPERVSGSDLVPTLCQVAAEHGYRVFLLGAAPGVAESAQRWLEDRTPRLKIVGTYAPPLGFDTDEHESARTVRIVREAKPDIVFAAFGAPKQEKWLSRFRDALDVPVSMGVGSALDYLAGRLKRAPIWMQRAGLEWTFRLIQEPRRLWRRYLVENPPFVYYVLKQRFGGRLLTKPRSDWSRHERDTV